MNFSDIGIIILLLLPPCYWNEHHEIIVLRKIIRISQSYWMCFENERAGKRSGAIQRRGQRGGGGVWWERKWTHEHKRFPIHGSKSKTTKEGKNECIKHAIWLFTPISQTNEIQFLRIFNVINFHTFRLRTRWLKVLVSAIFSPYVTYNTQTQSIIEPDKKGTPNHTHTTNKLKPKLDTIKNVHRSVHNKSSIYIFSGTLNTFARIEHLLILLFRVRLRAFSSIGSLARYPLLGNNGIRSTHTHTRKQNAWLFSSNLLCVLDFALFFCIMKLKCIPFPYKKKSIEQFIVCSEHIFSL